MKTEIESFALQRTSMNNMISKTILEKKDDGTESIPFLKSIAFDKEALYVLEESIELEDVDRFMNILTNCSGNVFTSGVGK